MKSELREKHFLLLPLILFLVLFTHNTHNGANSRTRFATIERLLEARTAVVAQSPFFSATDAVKVHGKFYSDKPPLLQIYSAIVIYPLHHFYKFNTSKSLKILMYSIVFTSSGFAALAIYFLLSQLCGLLAYPPRAGPWIKASILFASCIMPFSTVYNSHIVEALLVLFTFYCLLKIKLSQGSANHKTRFVMMLCSGLALSILSLVHIFPAIIFIGLTVLYFLKHNIKHCILFIAIIITVNGFGLMLNHALYQEYKPAYLMPEAYFFKHSPWLTNPSLPGLKEERLNKRLTELYMPDRLKVQVLANYHAYQDSIRNPITFAWKRFTQYDYLILNPLFILSLFALFRLCLSKQSAFRTEWLWVLFGILGMYFGAIYLKSVPGSSFGNRHLLSLIPITFLAAGSLWQNPHYKHLLTFSFWTSLIITIPGILHPWSQPNPTFLHTTLIYTTTCNTILITALLFKPFNNTIKTLIHFLQKNYILGITLILTLTTLSLHLYAFSSLTLLTPKLAIIATLTYLMRPGPIIKQ